MSGNVACKGTNQKEEYPSKQMTNTFFCLHWLSSQFCYLVCSSVSYFQDSPVSILILKVASVSQFIFTYVNFIEISILFCDHAQLVILPHFFYSHSTKGFSALILNLSSLVSLTFLQESQVESLWKLWTAWRL